MISDGSQYLLPVTSDGSTFLTTTLSPDGRWLGWSEGADFHLRQLTGTQVRRVTGRSEIMGAVWSGDARWLLLTENRSGEFTMVDMVTDQTTHANGLTGKHLVGISYDGAVLQAAKGQSRADDRFGFIEFEWVDPITGRIRTIMKATPGGQLEYPDHFPLLLPGTQTVVVPLFQASSTDDPYFAKGPTTALVAYDLADGHVVTRLDLSGDGVSMSAGITTNGVLLARENAGGVEVWLIDVLTGSRTEVAHLPAGSKVTLRGGVGH